MFNRILKHRPAAELVDTLPLHPSNCENWQSWEIELLLQTIEANQLVGIVIPASATNEKTLQSLIIGFDIRTDSLLLDSIYPNPVGLISEILDRKSMVVISIPFHLNSKHCYYNISATISEIKNNSSGHIIAARIVTREISTSRTNHSRLSFNRKFRPRVELYDDSQRYFNGWLCDLGQDNCLIEFNGADARSSLQNKTVSLVVQFNPQFEIKIKGRVVSTKFYRKPSCHNQLRIQLFDITMDDQIQINTFIDAVAELNQPETGKWEIFAA